MQENKDNAMQMQREYTALQRLAYMEDLAEKKARIYSRLLMDVMLAQEMEGLAERHQQRKTELLALCGKRQKEDEE